MFEKIKGAKKRLWGHSNITPIMTSRTLDRLSGAKVYLKCENFQRTGAFKFRGAFNAISRLSKIQQERGIITYSCVVRNPFLTTSVIKISTSAQLVCP
ncbi:MAG: pyridoxal-phosphate dependent enzyme [candidate division Zixibacteria bacterium]|nr:pyridoxal-phosphate dependent enzyme [candidate division Zixibacteria bacterium]